MSARQLVKKLMPRKLFLLLEPYGHFAEAVVLQTLYGFPARRLKVVGVTGTNGKTTTCFLIYTMLQEAGYKVGMMTTVAYAAGDDIRPQIQHMTNVPVRQFIDRLRWMRSEGIEWLVLETTSHALAQHRVWGVPYNVAVMTNLTHEHQDYHRTFDRYRKAKLLLFEATARNKHGLRTGIVNADDPSWKYFADVVPNSVTYGLTHGELQATSIHTTPKGSDFEIKRENSTLKAHINLLGSFNVSNALAAVGLGIAIGLNDQQIISGIAALQSVEGRMTVIDEGQDFDVMVDFAHTPDSFEKLFKEVKPAVKGKLIVLFGSAGRRDQAKRAVQGRLAGEYADEVVITEEDDRDENGAQIMEQIAAGAEKAGKVRGTNLFLVHDRTEAIGLALGQATKEDTVLLLGKGHEKSIERANGAHLWDEIAIVRRALRNLRR